MAGAYRPAAFNSRDDRGMQSSRPTYPQHRQQRNAAVAAAAGAAEAGVDSVQVIRMKEQAQAARFKETLPIDEGVPTPLFGPPVKKNRMKDPVKDMITKVLGNYEEVKTLPSYASYVGVEQQPCTPIRSNTAPNLFPPPDNRDANKRRDRDREREREREKQPQQKTENEQNQQKAERERLQQQKEQKDKELRTAQKSAGQQHNNGAFSSKNPKVKENPRDRDNLFENLTCMKSDSNSSGTNVSATDAASRRSRKDSKSGERHKERSSRDRSARNSTSSDHDVKVAHKSRDWRTASREKERRGNDHDLGRNDRPPVQSDTKSASQERNIDSTGEKRSNQLDTLSVAVTCSSSSKGNVKPGASLASSTLSPSHMSVEHQDSAESHSTKVLSNNLSLTHKSAAGSKGAASLASSKVDNESTFTKPQQNGQLNGVVRRKDIGAGGDGSTSRSKQPKLIIPKQNAGGQQSSLSVERILKEMSGFDPPLTAIETPKKDIDSRFPFPTLVKEGQTAKTTPTALPSAATTTTTTTTTTAAAAAATQAIAAHSKAPCMGATELGSSAVSTKAVDALAGCVQHDDLAVSDSDSETDQKQTEMKQRRHSVSTDTKHRNRCSPKMSDQPVRSKMIDSSDSSSSGSDSSDSGSDSESSSSDNEKELVEAMDMRNAKSPMSLPAPPPLVQETTPKSWALTNWAQTYPSGLPGSEAFAPASQRASDTKDPNDDILNLLFQDKIPEPSPDPRLDDIAAKKKAKPSSETVLKFKKGHENTTSASSEEPPAGAGGWSVSVKTPPRPTQGRSPSSPKSRSSLSQSPSYKPRKSSSSKQPQEKEVSKSVPKVSPKKQPITKGSPMRHKNRDGVKRQGSLKTKGSPRIVAQKTPPSTNTDRKSTGGTSKRRKQHADSQPAFSDSSSDENIDVDVTSITPVKSKEVPRKPPTPAKGMKISHSGGGKGVRPNTDGTTGSKPLPVPPLKLVSIPAYTKSKDSDEESDNEEDIKEESILHQPKSLNLPLEDVFGTFIQDPILSPIPGSSHLTGPTHTTDSRKSSVSMPVHHVTEAPRKKQPQSPRSTGLQTPRMASPCSSSESGSNSDSSGSESYSHSTSRSSSRASSRRASRASSRASSRTSSRASSQASSRAISPVAAITTSTSLFVPSCTVAVTTPVSLPSVVSGPTGLTYNADGRPSLIVRLNLALINKLGHSTTSSTTSSLTTAATPMPSSSSASNLLPPPPPRDVETMNRKPVAVVEPQKSHIDKTTQLDIKLEPGVVGGGAPHHVGGGLSVPRDVHLPHQSSLLQQLHKDQTHMDTSAMAAMSSHAVPALVAASTANNKDAMSAFCKQSDTVLSKIIKDERKPPQTKIPKRKNPDVHTTEDKRPRTENRSTSGRRMSSGHTPTQSTPKSTEDSGEREVISYEDDHEWDRKYPQRSERANERDRRGDSCSSSSSSHHGDREHGAKQSKYDSEGRTNRDRERGRTRDRERERDKHRPLHTDWTAPNGDTRGNGAESASYIRGATHPVASHWSAISAGQDEGEWPPDRSDGDKMDQRHGWRPDWADRGNRAERGDRRDRGDRGDRGDRQDGQQRPEKTETPESADHYLSEARRLKHHADTLMDRLAKSLMYVEAVLSFIECGNAMEHERLSEPNKNVTMYKDTFSLIRHIYKFRGSLDGDVHDKEKKLSVLSLRIQSLLCLKLFNLKKTETTNLKRAIDDHTRNANQAPRPQAPSPYQPNWNRSTGTPSPISPTPSPAGSVGSVGSVGSNNGDHRSHTAPTTACPSNGSSTGMSTIAVPNRIHQITNNYISHVHNLVQCHELWEQGDQQAAEFPDFFRQLEYESVPISLHSSIPDLVHYVRTGLRRLTNYT